MKRRKAKRQSSAYHHRRIEQLRKRKELYPTPKRKVKPWDIKTAFLSPAQSDAQHKHFSAVEAALFGLSFNHQFKQHHEVHE